MLEDSASDQISAAAQRLYQDLPVAKILESGLKAQSAFVSSTETATTVLTNIAKIGALASLPIGIVLLNSYLRSEGAPLPAADGSISVPFSLVCVIFLFITVLLASIFLLPTFARISNSTSRSAADSFQHKKKRRVVEEGFKQAAKEYYLRFGPFLSFVLFVFFGVGLIENHRWNWIGPTVALASLAVYCWVYTVTHYRKFDYVLQSSMHSLASFFILVFFIIALVQSLNAQMPAWAVAFTCVGISLAVHILTVTLITHWKTALAAYVVILFTLTIWPGLGFLGGSTLQYIGIGGGIPVSIRVKSYSGTGTISGIEDVTGCLVLMTGGDVLIRPTSRNLDCRLYPKFMSGQSLTSVATYSRIERYARADVLRISKFPDPCGTVDGLSSC